MTFEEIKALVTSTEMTAEQKKKRADRDFVTNRVYKKRRVHF